MLHGRRSFLHKVNSRGHVTFNSIRKSKFDHTFVIAFGITFIFKGSDACR